MVPLCDWDSCFLEQLLSRHFLWRGDASVHLQKLYTDMYKSTVKLSVGQLLSYVKLFLKYSWPGQIGGQAAWVNHETGDGPVHWRKLFSGRL